MILESITIARHGFRGNNGVLHQERKPETNKRKGILRACEWGDIEKMLKNEFYGLYLINNSAYHGDGDKLVPTPPELMEPGKEHLYNISGNPGITNG